MLYFQETFALRNFMTSKRTSEKSFQSISNVRASPKYDIRVPVLVHYKLIWWTSINTQLSCSLADTSLKIWTTKTIKSTSKKKFLVLTITGLPLFGLHPAFPQRVLLEPWGSPYWQRYPPLAWSLVAGYCRDQEQPPSLVPSNFLMTRI